MRIRSERVGRSLFARHLVADATLTNGVRGLARQPRDIAVVVEMGGVMPRSRDQQRTLPERVVHGVLDGRDRSGLSLLSILYVPVTVMPSESEFARSTSIRPLGRDSW